LMLVTIVLQQRGTTNINTKTVCDKPLKRRGDTCTHAGALKTARAREQNKLNTTYTMHTNTTYHTLTRKAQHVATAAYTA